MRPGTRCGSAMVALFKRHAGASSAPLALALTCLVCRYAVGQYPPTCPTINKVVVCGGQRLFTDAYGQRETSLAIVTQGTHGWNARLGAIWIDAAQYVHPGLQQIGLSVAHPRSGTGTSLYGSSAATYGGIARNLR